ncbi:MAG: hypothetical protein RLZZ84_141 [Pseudomonadota bacterium]|jgi:hypothetical protein
MGLFKRDLYRSFAVGFGLGTAALLLALGIQSSSGISGQVISAAQAAPALPDQTR